VFFLTRFFFRSTSSVSSPPQARCRFSLSAREWRACSSISAAGFEFLSCSCCASGARLHLALKACAEYASPETTGPFASHGCRLPAAGQGLVSFSSSWKSLSRVRPALISFQFVLWLNRSTCWNFRFQCAAAPESLQLYSLRQFLFCLLHKLPVVCSCCRLSFSFLGWMWIVAGRRLI
jgi:hypothetical protein